MPVIGELATLITARTAPFEKAMDRSRKTTKDFSKAIEGQSNTMESKWTPALGKVKDFLAGPLGITLSIAGVIAGMKRFTSTILEHGQAIESMGETAAGIGMQASRFMALEFAAKQTGVTTEQLTQALRDFSIRTADAAEGSGDAAKAFEKMGINAKDFLQLPMEDRLKIVADELNAMQTEAERAAAASDLFSRAGKGPMLTMLAEGSVGIQKLTEAAEKLGLVLGDDVVAAIGRSNDALDRMKSRSEGLWRQMTAELMPAVGATIEEMEKAIEYATPEEKRGSGGRTLQTLAPLSAGPAGLAPLALNLLMSRQLGHGRRMVEEERGKILDAEIRRGNVQRVGAAAMSQEQRQTEYLRQLTRLEREEIEWRRRINQQQNITVQNLN
jgi:hypothetical protein